MQNQKYYIDDKGQLNLFFNAAPFNGPVKGKDLQNEYFTPNTDFGPLDTAISYLDHNNLAKSHPEIANLPGISDRLGVAHREMTTEEGIIYRIIVDERYRYKNMLKALMDVDALDASTTPYQKSFQKNPSTGEILRYEIVEVSPTWKPANPEAENIFKSIILKEIEMAEEAKQDAVVETVATSTETVSETPVTDAVEAVLSGVVEATTEKSIPDVLSEVMAELKAIRAEMTEFKTAQAAQEKSIKDFSIAIPKGFEMLGKNLKATVVEDSKRSPIEKAVVEQFQKQVATSDAPGRNLKSNVLGVKAN